MLWYDAQLEEGNMTHEEGLARCGTLLEGLSDTACILEQVVSPGTFFRMFPVVLQSVVDGVPEVCPLTEKEVLCALDLGDGNLARLDRLSTAGYLRRRLDGLFHWYRAGDVARYSRGVIPQGDEPSEDIAA